MSVLSMNTKSQRDRQISRARPLHEVRQPIEAAARWTVFRAVEHVQGPRSSRIASLLAS
jgi:hypothetical protein